MADDIKVPLEEWMKVFGERIATEAAERAVARHAADCTIRRREGEIFGNVERPGILGRVKHMEEELNHMANWKRYALNAIVGPVLAAVFTVAALRVLPAVIKLL